MTRFAVRICLGAFGPIDRRVEPSVSMTNSKSRIHAGPVRVADHVIHAEGFNVHPWEASDRA